jgi:hypothetical protein
VAEINEAKLREFIDQRRAALEEQLRQFEASFAMFVNSGDYGTASVLFSKMAAKCFELQQLSAADYKRPEDQKLTV